MAKLHGYGRLGRVLTLKCKGNMAQRRHRSRGTPGSDSGMQERGSGGRDTTHMHTHVSVSSYVLFARESRTPHGLHTNPHRADSRAVGGIYQRYVLCLMFSLVLQAS